MGTKNDCRICNAKGTMILEDHTQAWICTACGEYDRRRTVHSDKEKRKNVQSGFDHRTR